MIIGDLSLLLGVLGVWLGCGILLLDRPPAHVNPTRRWRKPLLYRLAQLGFVGIPLVTLWNIFIDYLNFTQQLVFVVALLWLKCGYLLSRHPKPGSGQHRRWQEQLLYRLAQLGFFGIPLAAVWLVYIRHLSPDQQLAVVATLLWLGCEYLLNRHFKSRSGQNRRWREQLLYRLAQLGFFGIPLAAVWIVSSHFLSLTQQLTVVMALLWLGCGYLLGRRPYETRNADKPQRLHWMRALAWLGFIGIPLSTLVYISIQLVETVGTWVQSIIVLVGLWLGCMFITIGNRKRSVHMQWSRWFRILRIAAMSGLVVIPLLITAIIFHFSERPIDKLFALLVGVSLVFFGRIASLYKRKKTDRAGTDDELPKRMPYPRIQYLLTTLLFITGAYYLFQGWKAAEYHLAGDFHTLWGLRMGMIGIIGAMILWSLNRSSGARGWRRIFAHVLRGSEYGLLGISLVVIFGSGAIEYYRQHSHAAKGVYDCVLVGPSIRDGSILDADDDALRAGLRAIKRQNSKLIDSESIWDAVESFNRAIAFSNDTNRTNDPEKARALNNIGCILLATAINNNSNIAFPTVQTGVLTHVMPVAYHTQNNVEDAPSDCRTLANAHQVWDKARDYIAVYNSHILQLWEDEGSKQVTVNLVFNGHRYASSKLPPDTSCMITMDAYGMLDITNGVLMSVMPQMEIDGSLSIEVCGRNLENKSLSVRAWSAVTTFNNPFFDDHKPIAKIARGEECMKVSIAGDVLNEYRYHGQFIYIAVWLEKEAVEFSNEDCNSVIAAIERWCIRYSVPLFKDTQMAMSKPMKLYPDRFTHYSVRSLW